MRMFARTYPLTAFFLLSYALAWLAWSPLVLGRSGLGLLPIDLSLWATLPGSYAPLVAACIVQWLSRGHWGFASLLVKPGRALGAALLGMLLVAVGFVLVPALWLTGGRMHAFDWAALQVYPGAMMRALLMAGPLGEEPGWRGFALPRLQARYGPAPATALLGVLWAGWHAPLFLVAGWNGAAPWAFGLLIAGLAFPITFCFNFSGRNVLVAMFMHAAFNASPAVLGGLLVQAEVTSQVRPDVMLAASFGGLAVLLLVVTRGRLGVSVDPTETPGTSPPVR